MSGVFANRAAAGRALAAVLAKMRLHDPVVLALPRGGVPVAAEIAQRLEAPLDLVFVARIGVPFHQELAAAAVVDGKNAELVVNQQVRGLAKVAQSYLESEAKRQLAEIERRRGAYLQGRPTVPIRGRTAIVVDDGIATGTTVRAVVQALRRRKPKTLILAVPVAPADTVKALRAEVDELVCLETPDPFYAVGLHYRDFHQVSDAEVVGLLGQMAEIG
jgi:Predicted phosphoribosyltransferases